MENNELQLIWRTMDSNIQRKSMEELNLLLTSKARQVFAGLLIWNIISVPICAGLIAWLIFSTANRLDDMLYVTNNILLGSIVLFALFYVIRELYYYRQRKMDKPVKEWLETEIQELNKRLTGKYRRISFYLIPVLYILSFLSIHVYQSELNFTEVFRSNKFLNEDIWGIVIFTPLLFAFLYYLLVKLRRHQMKKLQFLRDLYDRLCVI